MSTTTSLASESRVQARAHEELRRNLDALSNALRGASYDSLGGFDKDGVATAPVFQRASGYDTTGVTLDSAQTLQWRSTSTRESVEGVSAPGELVLVQDGVTTTLAKSVPAGGFEATLVGNRLKVRLTTYCTGGSTGCTASVSGETTVSLRN
jgi:hypothetical protein